MIPSTVGIIGVGGMGLAMAERLMQAGHEVIGYRRSAMGDFIAAGGVAAASVREVGDRAELILMCLPSADAIEDAMEGESGLLAGLKAGTVIVEMSTALVAEKRRAMERVAEKGVALLDCPISGTPGMMRESRAAIFASGESAAFEICRPVLNTIAPRVTYVGAFGGGTVAKHVANLLVGVHNLAAAEALAFAVREGADPKAIHEAITGSPASSAMFEMRGAMMAAHAYGDRSNGLSGFFVGFKEIVEGANAIGAYAPLSTRTAEIVAEALEKGFDGPDQAAIYEYMLAAAGNAK